MLLWRAPEFVFQGLSAAGDNMSGEYFQRLGRNAAFRPTTT